MENEIAGTWQLSDHVQQLCLLGLVFLVYDCTHIELILQLPQLAERVLLEEEKEELTRLFIFLGGGNRDRTAGRGDLFDRLGAGHLHSDAVLAVDAPRA